MKNRIDITIIQTKKSILSDFLALISLSKSSFLRFEISNEKDAATFHNIISLLLSEMSYRNEYHKDIISFSFPDISFITNAAGDDISILKISRIRILSIIMDSP